MQARYSKNLKNAPYSKIMPVERVGHNSNCCSHFIKYSRILEKEQVHDRDRDVH